MTTTAAEDTTASDPTRILQGERCSDARAAAARVAALYEEHAAMVLAVCRGLLRGSAEAEDAAQQTFLSAQRALANGSEPREPAAWLATIARNECVARVRARMHEPLPTDAEPDSHGSDSHAEAVRRAQVADLRDAIGSLPEQQRDAILLREVRGLSYDEVATTLAVTPAAVESLLFRARRGLQGRLRNAWAGLTPVGWLDPVRELVGRLAAGSAPVAAPVAAKAVAVGVGAAVVAGGAVVGPQVLGSGHASRPATQRSQAPAAPAQSRQAQQSLPSTGVFAVTPPAARDVVSIVHRRQPSRAGEDGVRASSGADGRTPSGEAEDGHGSTGTASGDGGGGTGSGDREQGTAASGSEDTGSHGGTVQVPVPVSGGSGETGSESRDTPSPAGSSGTAATPSPAPANGGGEDTGDRSDGGEAASGGGDG
jgi:RNA polymerase sigma factor (sigma-70 family)